MEQALDVLRFCPAMEARHKAMMEREVRKVATQRAKANDIGPVARVLDF